MDLMDWTTQREGIFLDRYALHGPKGELLEHNPVDMWSRISGEIADTPQERIQFMEAFTHWRFVPGGRILSGAGSGKSVVYYNCFVLGTGDSRKQIMRTIADMVEITSRGGGVGINWSVLRPEGTYIKGVHGTSSGPNSWMAGADAMSNSINQGGTRTAALMFMMDVWHPDILKFVTLAERFKRANYSVAISHEFMDAVKADDDWDLIFPDTSCEEYEAWDGDITAWKRDQFPVIIHKTMKAKEIWDALCKSAIETGNPGIVFLDKANYWSNSWYLDRLVGTNPCGEQPLPEFGACNLGSINLLAHLSNHNKKINYTQLGNTVRAAVRFLDNVIDESETVLDIIEAKQQRDRRIGLGTMGLADILILQGIRYGSPECTAYLHDLYSFIRDSAYEASVLLAEEKGPAPGFSEPYYMRSHFIQTLPEDLRHKISLHGIRNLHLLTQAPTGTTAILAGASNGIEPIFMAKYTRNDATGCHIMTHPLFEGQEALSPAHVTAHNLSIDEHLAVQSTVQKYVDSSISKTINLPPDSTEDDVSYAYQKADDLGCKGITVYRSSDDDGVCLTCDL